MTASYPSDSYGFMFRQPYLYDVRSSLYTAIGTMYCTLYILVISTPGTLNTTPKANSQISSRILFFLLILCPEIIVQHSSHNSIPTHRENEERIQFRSWNRTPDPGLPEARSNKTLSRARNHVLGPCMEHRHDIHHHEGSHGHDRRSHDHGHGHGASQAGWCA